MGQVALLLAVPTVVGAAAAVGAWVGLWAAKCIASALVDGGPRGNV